MIIQSDDYSMKRFGLAYTKAWALSDRLYVKNPKYAAGLAKTLHIKLGESNADTYVFAGRLCYCICYDYVSIDVWPSAPVERKWWGSPIQYTAWTDDEQPRVFREQITPEKIAYAKRILRYKKRGYI